MKSQNVLNAVIALVSMTTIVMHAAEKSSEPVHHRFFDCKRPAAIIICESNIVHAAQCPTPEAVEEHTAPALFMPVQRKCLPQAHILPSNTIEDLVAFRVANGAILPPHTSPTTSLSSAAISASEHYSSTELFIRSCSLNTNKLPAKEDTVLVGSSVLYVDSR